MDGTLGLVLTMLVAMNPANVARVAPATSGPPQARVDMRLGALAVGIATGVLVLLAALADPIVDVLDITGPTFRLGAAIVVGVAGARSMVWPGPPVPGGATAVSPLAVFVLAALLVPGTVFVAVGGGAVHGFGPALLAVLVAAAASLASLAGRAGPPGRSWLLEVASRFVGAGAIVVAIAVGIDAARTV
jgi:hypothetical protein